MSSPVFGAIADDFTGATDLADQLVAGGMRTVQLIGTAGAPIPADIDAVVIALKTRTIAAADAVAQSLAALALLETADVRQLPGIDVGVPWTVVDATPRLGLALKSGNFGGPDFFTRALAMTE